MNPGEPNGSTESVIAKPSKHDTDPPGVEPDVPSAELASTDRSNIGIDEIFEILRNQRRRWVLRYVEAADGDVRLGELAEEIPAYENGKDASEITSQERKRVYVGLHQSHLPKMDDMNTISYDKPRGTTKAGENFELVGTYLPDEGKSPEGSGLRGHLYVSPISTLLVALFGVVDLLTPK